MSWVNLDDSFTNHPKIVGLTNGGFRLHVAGICYASHHLTDGYLAVELVPLLVTKYRRIWLSELVSTGLWLPIDDGYLIHDYLQWNRSRFQVNSERKRQSEAGHKGASRRWGTPLGNP